MILKKTYINEKTYFMDKKVQYHKDLCFPQTDL